MKHKSSGNNRDNLVGEVRHAGHAANAPAGATKRQATFAACGGNADIGKLLEENAQLRELVIQLTKIAIKNIVDPARRMN